MRSCPARPAAWSAWSRPRKLAGFDKVIGFDMGGTSTDVAHYDGDYERAFETEVAGVRMRAPMMRIHTVAAGGGSILHFEAGRFRVGPDSAGANPGPACYRRGGPLTVTDANVMLGKLQPDFFPAIFGPSQDQPLDADAVRDEVRGACRARSATAARRRQVAEGFVTIAVENMANAIKKISVQRGYDVTEYLLNCFGGAGGQHACLVADALGMEAVLIHPFSGLLSAYGMGLAGVFASRQQALLKPLADESLPTIDRRSREALRDAVLAELAAQGIAAGDVVLAAASCTSATTAPTPRCRSNFGSGSLDAARDAFEAAHKAQFGFVYDDKPMIVEAVGVEGSDGRARGRDEAESALRGDRRKRRRTTRQIFVEGAWHEAGVFRREELRPGPARRRPGADHRATRPSSSSPAGRPRSPPRTMSCCAASRRSARQRGARHRGRPGHARSVQQPLHVDRRADGRDAAEHRLFGQHQGAARFLLRGVRPRPARWSPTRRTCRCISARWTARSRRSSGSTQGDIQPGDVFALNAPYNGGTHLPDITVVTPVFDDAGRANILF